MESENLMHEMEDMARVDSTPSRETRNWTRSLSLVCGLREEQCDVRRIILYSGFLS